MKFTEEDIHDFVNGCRGCEDKIEGDRKKYTQSMTAIVEVDGKHYRIKWEDYRFWNDDEYDSQDAPEVRLVERQETITVREWVPV